MQEKCQNQTDQPLAPGKLKAFDPEALIHVLENVIEPDIAARSIDAAMFYLVGYVINENIATKDHFDLYWSLREMRNAILSGAHLIDLH